MANSRQRLQAQRVRRTNRTRTKLADASRRPRLVVSRSLRHMRAQVIEPGTGKVLAAATTQEFQRPGTKTEAASAVGKLVAERALKQSVAAVTFDRGGRKFHGRIKAVADGARAAGLQF